jgi:hypothetical protein
MGAVVFVLSASVVTIWPVLLRVLHISSPTTPVFAPRSEVRVDEAKTIGRRGFCLEPKPKSSRIFMVDK